MILLIDVGNSNTNLAIYDLETKQYIQENRITTDANKTADEYSIILNTLLRDLPIDDIVIGSVVPKITDLLIHYSEKYLNITPLSLSQGLKTGLDIRLSNPREIGADLVAAAVGALKHYPEPAIVIDMGTATTMTFIDKGTFNGGAIMPGIETSLFGLVSKTALLPQIDIKAPKRVVEKETISCMQSGIVYGTASMIDGMIDRIEEEQGKKCYLIATGGLASYIVPHCKHKITIDRHLIFEGLLEIYYKNQRDQ